MQYIVICLRDKTDSHPATYVQTTRRRFLNERDAEYYKDSIAPTRQPVIVPVPSVKLDGENYPIRS